ncbi:hypothetical protein SAMN05444355_101303 [Flavobacterium frigoris]|uniref:Uncharacterized protein n=1 Tax=Flavobacterium frigoris TaxID=229204 RepID=A0A1H9CXJ8_FLAFI|nr:hypothetical protein SAMN05444355_101303 [Flavobacterium frigoris]
MQLHLMQINFHKLQSNYGKDEDLKESLLFVNG